MHSEAQPMSLRGSHDFLGISNVEIAALAKDVATLGETRLGDPRQHFVNDEGNILFRSASKFIWHRVGSKKSWNEFQRGLSVQASNRAKQFYFVFLGKAVA